MQRTSMGLSFITKYFPLYSDFNPVLQEFPLSEPQASPLCRKETLGSGEEERGLDSLYSSLPTQEMEFIPKDTQHIPVERVVASLLAPISLWQ